MSLDPSLDPGTVGGPLPSDLPGPFDNIKSQRIVTVNGQRYRQTIYSDGRDPLFEALSAPAAAGAGGGGGGGSRARSTGGSTSTRAAGSGAQDPFGNVRLGLQILSLLSGLNRSGRTGGRIATSSPLGGGPYGTQINQLVQRLLGELGLSTPAAASPISTGAPAAGGASPLPGSPPVSQALSEPETGPYPTSPLGFPTLQPPKAQIDPLTGRPMG